jgi:hypothetical protein
MPQSGLWRKMKRFGDSERQRNFEMALRAPSPPLIASGRLCPFFSLLLVEAAAPDSPIQSFPDLLSRAKADPGKLTYAITSLDSIHHIRRPRAGGARPPRRIGSDARALCALRGMVRGRVVQ